jgi:Ni2+-binding GTPase involved in maturation of urease and hydrogenase
MIRSVLAGWELTALDTLFIENVGNPFCQTGYDLGGHPRVVRCR